ncbi:MAG: Holliday junction resolvase, partial [Nanoarchaeota archaeon]|nr:Holliday junction resolvase [Nanoarchaeota archaeon]
MGSKTKGTRYERELLHLFYDNGFMPVRIAGSGNVTIPSVDLLVGKKGVVFAIECKSIKKGTKYIDKEKIGQLVEFATNFGATPLVGMRFDRVGWFFMNVDELRDSGNCYAVGLNDAKEKG